MTKSKTGSTPQVSYLGINGKYLTPNTSVIESTAAITGRLNSSTATDWQVTPDAKELSINLTIQSATGSLLIYFDVLDPIESANSNVISGQNAPIIRLPLTSSPISSPQTLRLVITNYMATIWINNSPTSLGAMAVPFKWQLEFELSGTTPSFGVIGTFEARD